MRLRSWIWATSSEEVAGSRFSPCGAPGSLFAVWLRENWRSLLAPSLPTPPWLWGGPWEEGVGAEVEKCLGPSWEPFQEPPRPLLSLGLDGLDGCPEAAAAASTPGKRGSGQKQRERTLKEDVSQPTLPPPLGGNGTTGPVLLGTAHQGRRNPREPHRDALKTLYNSEASVLGNPKVQGPARSRPRGLEVPGVRPHGKKALEFGVQIPALLHFSSQSGTGCLPPLGPVSSSATWGPQESLPLKVAVRIP